MLMATTCLMGSSLRAKLDPEISCSDASPTGGGGAVATEFMPEPFTVQHEGQECWTCDRQIRQFRHEQRYPCPANCRAAFCSLECMWKHRDPELRHESRACVRGKWHPPKFGERFSGPHAPLTHAVATMGCIEVQKPFDILIFCRAMAFSRRRGAPRWKASRMIRGSTVSIGRQSAVCFQRPGGNP